MTHSLSATCCSAHYLHWDNEWLMTLRFVLTFLLYTGNVQNEEAHFYFADCRWRCHGNFLAKLKGHSLFFHFYFSKLRSEFVLKSHLYYFLLRYQPSAQFTPAWEQLRFMFLPKTNKHKSALVNLNIQSLTLTYSEICTVDYYYSF